jgi:glycerate 2-kinase
MVILKKLAELIMVETGIDLQLIPGSGAAGGLGGGLGGFYWRGFVVVLIFLLDTVNFEELIKGAELVITGEGCFDEQSLSGKVVSGITKVAREVKVFRLLYLPGSVLVGRDVYMKAGITAAFSTNRRPCTLEKAMGMLGRVCLSWLVVLLNCGSILHVS